MKGIVFALLLLGVAMAGPNTAEKSSGAVPAYDPATEVTLNGTVSEVKDFSCKFSKAVESHLELKLAGGSVMEIHLAPAKFMKDYGIVINTGAAEVIGSKVTYQDSPTILARKVTQEERVYEFRDKQGKPYW